MRAWPVVLLVVALAGCGDDGESAPVAPTTTQLAEAPVPITAPVPPEPATVAFNVTACQQLWARLPIPIEEAQAAMPPGFRVVNDDGDGFVDLIVRPILCEVGELVGVDSLYTFGMDMIVLEVEPPSDPGDDRSEYLALSALVHHDRIFAALAKAGAPIEPGEVTLQDDGVEGARAAVWRAAGSQASHSVRTQTIAAALPPAPELHRYWLIENNTVAGVLHWDQGAGLDDGTGTAVLTDVTSGRDPPAQPGTANRSRDIEATATYWGVAELEWYAP